MKERISATVDEKTVKIIGALIKNKKFRNKSHVIEAALESFAKMELKNAN